MTLTTNSANPRRLISQPLEESQADVLLHTLSQFQHAENVFLWCEGECMFNHRWWAWLHWCTPWTDGQTLAPFFLPTTIITAFNLLEEVNITALRTKVRVFTFIRLKFFILRGGKNALWLLALCVPVLCLSTISDSQNISIIKHIELHEFWVD